MYEIGLCDDLLFIAFNKFQQLIFLVARFLKKRLAKEIDTLIKLNHYNICRDVNYYYQMEECMENCMQKQTY